MFFRTKRSAVSLFFAWSWKCNLTHISSSQNTKRCERRNSFSSFIGIATKQTNQFWQGQIKSHKWDIVKCFRASRLLSDYTGLKSVFVLVLDDFSQRHTHVETSVSKERLKINIWSMVSMNAKMSINDEDKGNPTENRGLIELAQSWGTQRHNSTTCLSRNPGQSSFLWLGPRVRPCQSGTLSLVTH